MKFVLNAEKVKVRPDLTSLDLDYASSEEFAHGTHRAQ